MATKNVVIGVDGGGTKTKCVVIDVDTRDVVCTSIGECTNPNSIGTERASVNLVSVIAEAVATCQRVAADANVTIQRMVLGMSGVDRPKDKALVLSWLSGVYPHVCIDVYNDAVPALTSGTDGRLDGIVVISGTGMICWGKNSMGDERRVGGWGVYTDAGSGYWLAIEALKASWDAYDHSGPQTQLQTAIIEFTGVQAQTDLIDWTYGSQTSSWAKIASLARVVFACARQHNDAVAKSLITRLATHLSAKISVCAEQLSFSRSDDSVNVVLAGSIAQQPDVVRELQAALNSDWPNMKLIVPECDAAHGAALLALHTVTTSAHK